MRILFLRQRASSTLRVSRRIWRTQTVCVCLEHQNIKLMLHAAGINTTTIEIPKKTVCDLDNESCTVKKCASCPGNSGVELEIRNAPALSSKNADNLHVQRFGSEAHDVNCKRLSGHRKNFATDCKRQTQTSKNPQGRRSHCVYGLLRKLHFFGSRYHSLIIG